MLTRRRFLKCLGVMAAAGFSFGGYAVAVEPSRLRITRYRPALRGWPEGLDLRIAVLTDIHACRPWMKPERIAGIVERTNALKPDLVVLLGDFEASHPFVSATLPAREWAGVLAALKAPLGVFSILGNHDWWADEAAQRRGHGPTYIQRALERAGLPVLENKALRLTKDGHAVWLAGLGDQIALLPRRRYGRPYRKGVDDLRGTLSQVTDEAPVILLAHEPDIFPQIPARIALMLSGHTHGGQVRLLGHSPVVPSQFGNRYAYGYVIEPDRNGVARHLIVSGGLGCSIAPVRLGVPPEIVLVEPRANPLHANPGRATTAPAG